MKDLAGFIAPFDADTFRSQYFGRRPVHIRREAAGRSAILCWQRFNELLGITPYWNEDTLKVYFRNRAALRENYCDTGDLRPGGKAPADPAKVKALLGLGASLIANHVHRICPEVATIAHVLEREFAARVAANVYCSFKGVQAFGTHFDLHDVFALQVEGEKTWRVYEARADAPVVPLPPGDEIEKWLTTSRGPLLFEADMKPGDILYLPRGQYHDALTGAQASLHVSFGVSPATGLALFKLLESVVTQESAFRQYLPDARNPAELRDRLALLGERIKTVMTSQAFATDVLNHQRGLAGASADYGLPVQPSPVWYSIARRAQVVRRDSGYVAVFEEGEIDLGATHPTVEWILKQRLFSLGDALARNTSVDPAELRGVLAQLIAASVIVETKMRAGGGQG
ncbi:cupin domain-containing protein [Povalibacter sp.]|uniref:cupin domain-containing protein n=1 Tax=Povalibacter sp. TaxID=1962978 RepID=UPI002F424A6D